MRKTDIFDILSNNLLTIFFVLLFKSLLDYSYKNIISPMYYFAGLTVNENFLRSILSTLVLLILIFLYIIISKSTRPGGILISTLLLSSAVPLCTIIKFFDVSEEFVLLNLIYWILIVLLYFKFFTIKIKKRTSEFAQYFIFFIFSISVLLVCILYTGFNFHFNLFDVYKIRAAFESHNIPNFLTYLFSASIMVMPILFIYFIEKKRFFLSFLSIAVQIIAYSADARKSTLFALVATITGYLFIKKIDSRKFPQILSVIMLVGIFEKNILKSTYIMNLLIRRLFLLPAYLNLSYYSFFRNSEKDYLRQSVVGRFGFESPYHIKIANIIGNNFYLDSYANNGLFSDAYMNFGVFGVIIYPVLLVFILKLLDQCCKGLPIKLCLGLILVSTYTFISSSFFVVIITHGFLLGCLMMYLLPSGVFKNGK